MVVDWLLVTVVAVIFVATVIRSAFGFGEALVAVPLLALVMDVKVATVVAVLVSITVAAVIVLQDWRKIHVRSAWWLVFSALFGIPLGVWLTAVPEHVVKVVLALVLMVFSTYCLRRGTHLELTNDRLAWLFGFVSGILGGAYGMNAPPLVIYGSLRRWTPEYFRATMQGYFLPASCMVLCGHWWKGHWVPTVTHYYLLSLPGALAATLLGRAINRRLRGPSFILYIHAGLIVIGGVLLMQTFWQLARSP